MLLARARRAAIAAVAVDAGHVLAVLVLVHAVQGLRRALCGGHSFARHRVCAHNRPRARLAPPHLRFVGEHVRKEV